MRFLSLASAAVLLAACNGGGDVHHADPNPPGVEPVPTEADALGTESGGAAKEVSEITWSHFGTEPTLTESVKVKAFLDAPAQYDGKEVLLEGNVVDVCQKAGCWMVMSDGDRQIRVTMKDHGFAVDKQGAGSWAKVQGTVQQVEIKADVTAHFEGESNRPDLLPEKEGQVFQISATGVSLQDKPADLEAPEEPIQG